MRKQRHRAAVRRRRRRDARPQAAGSGELGVARPPGSHETLNCDLPAEKLADAEPRRARARGWTWRSKIASGRKSAGWSGRWCCELLDTAWKDHLLAMDHLRSSVGLRGYAQVDPKVEYKREGMRTYEQMWQGVDERVTDLIFRMEQLDEDFVGSAWVESEAIHEEAGSDDAQPAAGRAASGDRRTRRRKPKLEPIRNRAGARRPQRSVPLRQRQEVQELPHAQGRR